MSATVRGDEPSGGIAIGAVDAALAYHARTKHHVGRYARSLGYLDWAHQPNPFRTFEGASRVLLDEVAPTGAPPWDALDDAAFDRRALDARSLAQLFYDSLALSAWKQAGSNRWSLRVNPSSGNLHPTEAYALLPPVDGIAEQPVLAHYSPLLHALEVRRVLDEAAWQTFCAGRAPGTFLIGFTSIHWREAWKYGERAFRYCQHDLGHAYAAVCIAARLLGWRVTMLALPDELVARVLGVHEQSGPEAEHPDVLALVDPIADDTSIDRVELDVAALSLLARGPLCGEPNVLSEAHHAWPIIDVVARACVDAGPRQAGHARPDDVASGASGATPEHVASGAIGATPEHAGSRYEHAVRTSPARAPRDARQLVRERRSAVDMDARTSISRETFVRMLESTLPRVSPWVLGSLPTTDVHLLLFVHRVKDVEPGLYLLVRSSDAADALRAAMGPELEWRVEATLAGGALLVALAEADARRVAKLVSCHQDIAADGAFAVAMLARFEPTLRARGARAYRWLHWEAGAIGQLLYLEAEAAGVRSTGIGCFFDDAVHELLGFGDSTFQSLYHFTVGGPVDDARIRVVPAYHHRAESIAELSAPPATD